MNTYLYKILFLAVLLLSAFTGQRATPSSPPSTAPPIPPSSLAEREILIVEDATQTEATTTRDKIGFILGNILILSFYAFPMSYAEEWAFGDPRKVKQQPKKESSELNVTSDSTSQPIQTSGDEAAVSTDDSPTFFERLTRWRQKLPNVTAGLVAGGCLMAIVAIGGAVAFALYYHFTGQPEEVSQILPRFAYWFPFAFLGMVNDIPFKIFFWEDRRLRVFLRLIIWWFPRLIIIAFVIDPPFLQGLDPATTALTVLAIDAVLAAFCLGMYTAREQMRMKDIQ